jgi:hypothetical protein
MVVHCHRECGDQEKQYDKSCEAFVQAHGVPFRDVFTIIFTSGIVKQAFVKFVKYKSEAGMLLPPPVPLRMPLVFHPILAIDLCQFP